MDEIFDPYSLVHQQIQNNNEWSAQQAQNQMDFQREMSNTAHQREVADLKAAGLNPVLSAHTQGASTPSGAMGTTDHSGTQALVDLMSQMISADTAKTIAGYGGAGYGGGSSGYGISAKDNYPVGFGFGQMAQDFLTYLFGKTPKQAVKEAADTVKDFGSWLKWSVKPLPDDPSLNDIVPIWKRGYEYIKNVDANAKTAVKNTFNNNGHHSGKIPYENSHNSGTFYNKTKDRYINTVIETKHHSGKF